MKILGLSLMCGSLLAWIIVGNILLTRHYRRRGITRLLMGGPHGIPISQFTGKEWFGFIALFIAVTAVANLGRFLLLGR